MTNEMLETGLCEVCEEEPATTNGKYHDLELCASCADSEENI